MPELAKLERIGTGNAALDEVLCGGLPARSVTVLAGEPGSGKTALALQAVFHAARQGKRCVYFTTLSEPTLKFLRYLQLFTFFDEELFEERIRVIDLGTALRSGDPEAAFVTLTETIEALEPELVVIDSFKAIHDLIDRQRARTFAYDIAVHTAGWGATTLLLGEYTERDRSELPEFAIADGIIRLAMARQGLAAVRELEIHKLRGSGYVPGVHYFEIRSGGFCFYPRVRVSEEAPDAGIAPTRRLPTGVTGLDEMLTGGVLAESSTLLMGGTGAGKTTLGLHFLVAGARAGEPGVMLTLEEAPSQIRRNAAAIGLELAELERAGLFHFSYAAPVELSTDQYLQEATDLVRRVGARRVVLDSLTSLALGAATERRYKELVYALTRRMRLLGVTVFLTLETTETFGVSQLAGLGLSFAADNLLNLRYVELHGRLERAVSIVKARGTGADTQVRRLEIGADGIRIVCDERFARMRGLFSGVPVQEGP